MNFLMRAIAVAFSSPMRHLTSHKLGSLNNIAYVQYKSHLFYTANKSAGKGYFWSSTTTDITSAVVTQFKVTDVSTNQKPVCDFLLVNNTNLTSYLVPLPSYCRYLVKFLLSTAGLPLLNTFVRGKPINSQL